MERALSADGAASWRVWIDTGGTFTDCVGVSDSGEVRRRKVLSSGRVRASSESGVDGAVLRLRSLPVAPDGFFVGFRARPLRGGEALAVVRQDGRSLHLENVPGDWTLDSGGAVELIGPWEAPVLGLRLLFGATAEEELPDHRLRIGTTRGTNALLERRGARSALFVTRGFGDLLEIGDQSRPEIFARAIQRPEPLPEAVVEVAGRKNPRGETLEEATPAQLRELEREARALVERGIASASVSLVHSYLAPDHERDLAGLLEGCGFRTISLSSELSQLAGYLDRTRTAAVDAYLRPILETYLEEVAASAGREFHVMTSAGGLVRAAEFRAKDSLLSGPAGGVMGCLEACRLAEIPQGLAFDMGGTSTDVSRIAGSVEYDDRHDVGGTTVVAPALAIRTVAAGGGSICRIESGRVRVGPQSAGADPGPACYGRGGPLTVTDVNLLLGRIDGHRFEVPLEREAAERALLSSLEALSDIGREELLEGFLQIANERMAETIRRVSTRRGFDPADHGLVAFGGAGGQHACAVADLLGCITILVPDDCSLLSARGIGAAEAERIVQEQLFLDVEETKELARRIEACSRRAEERLRREEGLDAAAQLEVDAVLRLRYLGQDSGLEVAAEPLDRARRLFTQAYDEVFGYTVDRPVEAEWIRVRCSTVTPRAEPEAPDPVPEASPVRKGRVWWEGAFREVPVYERSSVPWSEERALEGPLLVGEEFTSTWVEGGWTAHREPRGRGLLLRRI